MTGPFSRDERGGIARKHQAAAPGRTSGGPPSQTRRLEPQCARGLDGARRMIRQTAVALTPLAALISNPLETLGIDADTQRTTVSVAGVLADRSFRS